MSCFHNIQYSCYWKLIYYQTIADKTINIPILTFSLYYGCFTCSTIILLLKLSFSHLTPTQQHFKNILTDSKLFTGIQHFRIIIYFSIYFDKSLTYLGSVKKLGYWIQDLTRVVLMAITNLKNTYFSQFILRNFKFESRRIGYLKKQYRF